MVDDAPSSRSTDVEVLLQTWLDEVEHGRGEDFEAWLAGHPDHATELRDLKRDFDRLSTAIDSALPGPLPDDDGEVAPHAGPVVEAGQVLAGDFRLERLIGRGGMGQVWEATQVSLGRRVALKLLRPGRGGESDAARLLAEARAAGRVTHDGLVTVHAAGRDGAITYIAQQLVGDGETLADLLNRRRDEPGMTPAAYRRLAEFFVDVADAVDAAHTAGVLHRDLKPRNILIGPDGRPRVGDFGLAHVADEEEAAARPGLVGTYAYMSPEQVSGKRDIEIDRRSDVFSLGVVFYEALTLRRAFEGDSARQILQRVRTEDPPDPRRIRSHVPRDLAVICLKAMAKDRAARYASMTAFAADLRRFLADEPIEARAPGPVERARKWMRRHPTLATGSLLGAAALLVISALLAHEVELRRTADDAARAARQSAQLASERADEALRRGYLASILAASLHLDRGHAAEARRRLAACPIELRGWEWHHLSLRADLSLVTLRGHEDEVLAVAASRDGAVLATASRDGTVRTWDGATGRARRVFHGHEGPVRAVAVSGDGTTVVSGGEDGTVRVWDGHDGSESARLDDHPAIVRAVAVSDDGMRLASGGEDGTVRVHDLDDGHAFTVTPAGSVAVTSVALSGDGARLVAGSRYGTVRVWDAGTGDSIGFLAWLLTDEVVVAVNGDGTRIASGGEDGVVHLWDGESGDELAVLPSHAFRISGLALSGRGDRLVSASADDGAVRLWDIDASAPLASLTGHAGRVTSAAMSADGSCVVAGVGDGTARVWDGRTRGAVVPIAESDRPATSLAASADGAVIVTASTEDGRLRAWDGRTGALRWQVIDRPYRLGPVAVSDDGARVVAGGYDGAVRLWDGRTGAPLATMQGHGGGVTSVAAAARGVLAVSGGQDGTVRVWDTRSGTVLAVLGGHEGVVTSVAASADGGRVASAGRDGRVQIWRASDGVTTNLRPGAWNDDGVVAVSADGRRVAWGALRRPTVVVWDTDRAEPIVTMEVAGSGLTALALGPDGRRVAGALAGVRDVHLWNADSGDVLAVLAGHAAPVWAVTMTADGRRLVSGDVNGAVLVWETDLDSALALWRRSEPRR